MPYRHYRLRLTSHGGSHTDTFRPRKPLQNLEAMFKDRTFSGEDPILIFDFWTRLVEEAETLEIFQGQLMVLLPYLLAGSAADQYQAAANGSRSGSIGAIFHWTEAVQHLVQRYETEQRITEAIENFNDIHQT